MDRVVTRSSPMAADTRRGVLFSQIRGGAIRSFHVTDPR
jgi:hypothetical protein